jgi:hypothetical protein
MGSAIDMHASSFMHQGGLLITLPALSPIHDTIVRATKMRSDSAPRGHSL